MVHGLPEGGSGILTGSNGAHPVAGEESPLALGPPPGGLDLATHRIQEVRRG